MGMTNAFRNWIANIAQGGTPTKFDNTNAYLGVGDSTTAFAATQTDLQAATNKFRQGMEATYPTIATNVLTYLAIFADGDAEFAWEEWGIFNAAAAGDMMCRKVASLGTKSAGEAWTLTATITIAAG